MSRPTRASSATGPLYWSGAEETEEVMALHETIHGGVATIVMDNPPVNALGSADTYGLADLLNGYGRAGDVRAVVLTAEGRGFCAGVDIKEIQAMDGH